MLQEMYLIDAATKLSSFAFVNKHTWGQCAIVFFSNIYVHSKYHGYARLKQHNSVDIWCWPLNGQLLSVKVAFITYLESGSVSSVSDTCVDSAQNRWAARAIGALLQPPRVCTPFTSLPSISFSLYLFVDEDKLRRWCYVKVLDKFALCWLIFVWIHC